ncbi:MAG: ATP-binding protein [Spirochaetota bacterium]
MNLFSHLSFTAAFFYLLIGLYALLKDYNGFVNRLFFFLSTVFSIWALANSLGIAADNSDSAYAVYRYFSWVFFLFPAPLLHFSLRVSHRIPSIRSRYILLLYIPGIVLFLFSHLGFDIIAAFHLTRYGWSIVYNSGSPLYYLNILHYTVYLAATIAVYLHWLRHAPTIREKKQARTILLTFGIGFLLSSLTGTLLPLVRDSLFPPMAPIFMTIWIFGIGYAILRYRLLYPGPDIAALTILQHIHDTVLLCNKENRILYGNRMAIDISGYHSNELTRLQLQELFPAIESPREMDDLSSAVIPTHLLTKQGKKIPVLLSISNLKDSHEDDLGYVCTAHDQRPIRNLEAEKEMHRSTAAALRASEEKFMKAFYLSPIGMAILNPETQHIEEMNASGKAMFGLDKDARLENSYPFLQWIDNCQRDYFFQELNRIGRIETFSSAFVRSDEATLDVLISADQIVISGLPHLLFYFFDITQLNKLETDLINMQKFETVALMAGGIAHDFNNLLTSISGNIALSRYNLRETPEGLDLLSSAEAACNRASDLTSKLLSFSKYSHPQKKDVDIVSIIRESLALSIPQKSISTSIDAPADISKVSADEVQMVQVFNNLFINAKQAMNGRGSIFVQVRNYRTDAGESLRKPRIQPIPLADYVMVTVRDTGSGIPAEQIQFLFDPYFTTKEQGNGLGLTVVYAIVKKHGGEIQVESTTGKGTSFIIYLPSANESSS